MTTNIEIATIIKQQIGFWNLAACGAKNFFALEETTARSGGLVFQITIEPRKKHWIEIDLTWIDDYTVRLVTMKDYERIVINEIAGAYAEDLGELIYSMGNKPEYYDPEKIAAQKELEETQRLTFEMYQFGALRRRCSRFEAVPPFQYAYAASGRSLYMCATARPMPKFGYAAHLQLVEDNIKAVHGRIKHSMKTMKGNALKVQLRLERGYLDGLYLAKHEIIKQLAKIQ